MDDDSVKVVLIMLFFYHKSVKGEKFCKAVFLHLIVLKKERQILQAFSAAFQF